MFKFPGSACVVARQRWLATADEPWATAGSAASGGSSFTDEPRF
ncbi:hypothetical protein [Sanguibacter sp. 25GB23B1]